MPATHLLLSTSDTDLLSARASGAGWRLANPVRLAPEDLPALLDGVELVVVRILGGHRDWQDGFDLLRAAGKPLVVVGGEQSPDAELMALSTVPAGVATQTHAYLAHGGADNLAAAAPFPVRHPAADRPRFRRRPSELPAWGIAWTTGTDHSDAASGPIVGVLYYRAHHVAGNTAFVAELCRAITAHGAVPMPMYCSSLRVPEPALLGELARADALVVTVLAAGGTRPAGVGAGQDDEAWDVAALAALDVPILQGLCLTAGRDRWLASAEGLSPLDTATQVAVPEFDGRLITVPFSVQGDRRRRAVGLRARRRALRPGGRDRRAARPPAARRTARQAHRDGAVRLSHEAFPDRQRGRPGHPGQRGRPAAQAARGRLRRRRDRRSGRPARPGRPRRRRVDRGADRGGRAGSGLADRRAAGHQSDPEPRTAAYASWFAHPAGRPAGGGSSGTGARRPATCSSTAPALRHRGTRPGRSCWRRCERATWH